MEKRLFRLIWNDKWAIPFKHKWDKRNQKNSKIAYEKQYGFGGEEWLFNPRYQIDGFQYGFIRGVQKLKEGVKFIDEAYLFTIDPGNSQRYLIGIINNLERIVGNKSEEKIAKRLFDKYLSDMKGEVNDVGADTKGLEINPPFANVKFKINGNEPFENRILIPALTGKYNRFQPYIIDDQLESILSEYKPKKIFEFISGIAKNKAESEKKVTGSTRTIIRFHSEITNTLIKYLGTVDKGDLSVEKSKFGNNIADVVIKYPDNYYTIMEVKTSLNIRGNIREALGQLIDYAFWSEEILIKELIIISPAALENYELQYFERIKNTLNLNLSYWQYIPNVKKGQAPFIKIS